MSTLLWIIVASVAMNAITFVGAFGLFLSRTALDRLIQPLVAFAAGSLLGGSFFHMMPEAVADFGEPLVIYVWVVAGFVAFFVLEQFLHWHHGHGAIEHAKTSARASERAADGRRRPLGLLIVVGDALHNLLGGVAVGGAFLVDVRLGVMTWVAAAAHEIPQELGDFAVLVHSGWSTGRALLVNALAGLPFMLGALLTYAMSSAVDLDFLLAFAAGNFIYIAASDLIPEIKHHRTLTGRIWSFSCFVAGALILLALKWFLG